MKTKFNIIKLIFLIAILTIEFVVIFVNSRNNNSNNLVNTIVDFIEKPSLLITNQTKIVEENNQSTNNINEATGKTLPNKVDLEVPFTTQAPFANWDNLHNDGCEEASVVSVIYYLQNKALNKDQAEDEIQSQVSWQMDNFGGHYDLPIEKATQLVEKFYKRKTDVFYDITIAQIKSELASGNPIIVPLAGRIISNPYYRSPGPVYHMLVIRGYDDEKQQFITNDVGTKRGESYSYDYNKLYNAIHDMPTWQQNKITLDANPEMIFSGKKAMLIIK